MSHASMESFIKCTVLVYVPVKRRQLSPFLCYTKTWPILKTLLPTRIDHIFPFLSVVVKDTSVLKASKGRYAASYNRLC